MKTYVVCQGDDPNKIWSWIRAESRAQIEAAFNDLSIHDVPPKWATPVLIEDLGGYHVDGPLASWLEKLRRR